MIYIPSKWREHHHISKHPREMPSGVRTFEVQSCFQRRCCMGLRQWSVFVLQQTPIPDQHGVPALCRIPASLLRHWRSSFCSERAILYRLHLELRDWPVARNLCHVFFFPSQAFRLSLNHEPYRSVYTSVCSRHQARLIPLAQPPTKWFTGVRGMLLHRLHRCWCPYSAKVDVQIPLGLSSIPWYRRRRPNQNIWRSKVSLAKFAIWIQDYQDCEFLWFSDSNGFIEFKFQSDFMNLGQLQLLLKLNSSRLTARFTCWSLRFQFYLDFGLLVPLLALNLISRGQQDWIAANLNFKRASAFVGCKWN